MKNRILKYVGNVGLVVLLLISVITLNIIVQNNTRSINQKKAKQSQATRLNVALVNEDRAIVADNTEYNLGASYIKNIERDNSQNWSVVSRGSAEKGLKDGKYQLMVTIPNDFSSKVLDINSVQADRANISYKVNANGNLQVENDANKLAKDIVADLNKQLVDLYIASILSNLYTAQQNVQTISGVQTANIGSYRTDLFQSAVGARNFFPTLASMSNSSVTANTSLKNSLESYSKLYDSLDNHQSEYGNSLESLIKSRASGNTSFEEFANAAIGMQGLNEQTQELYQAIKASQDNLNVQVGPSIDQINQQNINEKNYAALMVNLNNQIDELKTNLKEEEAGRAQQEQEIRKNVNNLLAAEFLGISADQNNGEVPNITLSQVLGNNKEQSNQLFENAKTLKKDAATIKNALATSQAVLEKEVKASVTTSEGQEATVTISVPENVELETVELGGARANFSPDDSGKYSAKVKFTNSLTNFSIKYKFKEGVKATDVASGISIALDNNTVANTSLKAAYDDYTSKVAELTTAYETAEKIVDTFYPKNNEGNRIDQNVGPDLSELLYNAVTSSLNSYKTPLKTTLEKLETSRDGLKKNLEDIQSTNNKLSKDINDNLKTLQNLQTQADIVKDRGDGVKSARADTDSKLSELEAGLKSLVAETNSAKSSSQSNVEQANSVNSIFSSFDKELETVKGNSEKLSTDAEGLMAKFEQELATNGDFVSSFMKVLNNAYNNGVPNETLMSFLSSPVGQSASSVRATVNVYRPFTWILLLEVVTLFTAYLFATQNIVKKVKDRFKLDKLEETDIVTVGILSGLSLIIGLAIGIISSSRLYVEKAYIPSWVLLVVLASFVLVQGQYLLLKHLKSIGMGICFFMIISFVYLSNAIGTTASLTGLPAFIKTFNALSILESSLSGYFDGRTVGVFMIGALIVLVIALTMANVFVNKKTTIVEEK